MKFFANIFAFAVDVDPFVDIARDGDFVSLEHFDMLAELEMVGIDEGAGDREVFDGNFVNDADVDEAVVEFCFRSDGGVVAELVAVGEGDEPGVACDGGVFVVEGEGVVVAFVGGVFSEDEAEVGGEAAHFSRLHEAGDEGVESHAGDAGDDEFVVEDDGVDVVVVLLVDDADGESGDEWDFEASGEAVAAAAGNDGEGGVGVLESADDIVDRAVAAAGGNDVVALVGGLSCDFGAVVDVFGIVDGIVEKVEVEIGFQYVFNPFLTSDARYWVDYDKEFFLHGYV